MKLERLIAPVLIAGAIVSCAEPRDPLTKPPYPYNLYYGNHVEPKILTKFSKDGNILGTDTIRFVYVQNTGYIKYLTRNGQEAVWSGDYLLENIGGN